MLTDDMRKIDWLMEERIYVDDVTNAWNRIKAVLTKVESASSNTTLYAKGDFFYGYRRRKKQ